MGGSTPLSTQLRHLADEIEDTEIDDIEQAQLSFRIDEETSRLTPVPIGQVDDPYEGTVMATIFTHDV